MGRAGRPLRVESELEFMAKYVEKNDYDSINMLISNHGIDCYNSYKRSFLVLAVLNSNESLLVYLIEKGADLNFQDKNGYSALHFAAQKVENKIAEILLKKGANPNLRDLHGNSPIWTAIMNAKQDYSIVKLLLSNKADIETKNIHGKSPKEIWNTIFRYDIESLIT